MEEVGDDGKICVCLGGQNDDSRKQDVKDENWDAKVGELAYYL
jgi:hypothetical protein